MKKSDKTNDQSTSSEAKEFEVERILDKKSKKGKLYYRVKWKDYPLSEATWEPKENLKNAKAAILFFERGISNPTQDTKKKKSKAQRNESPKGIEESDINIDEEKEAEETPRRNVEVTEKRKEKKKMIRHLKEDVVKAEEMRDLQSKEPESNISKSDETSKSLDINLTYNMPSMKILNIEYVKFIGDALYAYVSYYEGDSTQEKHKYLTTSELAILDPIKLIQFYESKVTFRAK